MNHILSLALLMIMHASLNLDAAGTHSKLPEKPEDTKESKDTKDTKPNKQGKHGRTLSLSTGSEERSTTDAPVVSPDPGNAPRTKCPETYQRGMPSFADAARSPQPTPQASPRPLHRPVSAIPDKTEELPSGSSDGARAACVVALRPLLTLNTARVVSLDDVKAARRIFNAAHAAGIETDYDSHATVDFIPKPDSFCAQRQEAIARLEKNLLKTDEALETLKTLINKYFEQYNDNPCTEALKRHTFQQISQLFVNQRYSEQEIYAIIEGYTCFPATCGLDKDSLPKMRDHGSTIKPAELLALIAWNRKLATHVNSHLTDHIKTLKKLDPEFISKTLQERIRHDRSKRALPEETDGLNYLVNANGETLHFSDDTNTLALMQAHISLFSQSQNPCALHDRKQDIFHIDTIQATIAETERKASNPKNELELIEALEHLRNAKQELQYAQFCETFLANQREVQAACDRHFSTLTNQDPKSLGFKREVARKVSSWLPWVTPAETTTPTSNSAQTFFAQTVKNHLALPVYRSFRHIILVGNQIPPAPLRALTAATAAAESASAAGSCTTPADAIPTA